MRVGWWGVQGAEPGAADPGGHRHDVGGCCSTVTCAAAPAGACEAVPSRRVRGAALVAAVVAARAAQPVAQVSTVRSPVSVCSTAAFQRAWGEDHRVPGTRERTRMRQSMPHSAAVSRRWPRISAAPALACSRRRGRNSWPRVCGSESERTPRRREAEQVPRAAQGGAGLQDGVAVLGWSRCGGWAAPGPEIPAPTTRASNEAASGTVGAYGQLPAAGARQRDGARRRGAVRIRPAAPAGESTARRRGTDQAPVTSRAPSRSSTAGGRGPRRARRPAARYLPDFRPGDAVTVRQLLSHTPGLPDPVIVAPAEGVQRVADWRLSAPPGTSPAYSNANHWTAARIMERVAGRPFDE
ncbi:MAG TPA: serine hydrolase domain-containing protein [Thermobifida alba]|nr:serine hydrolase domain-containing protein [Thermobifida alba]